MSEGALSVAEQAVRVRASRRSALWSTVPVVAIVVTDLLVSAAVFMLAYKLHHSTPMFIWKYKRSAFPVGVWDSFEPYLNLMLFVPFVKLYALRRYGLYKLRGEFSFSSDFIKIFNAATLAFLILVLIAFLFRQGFTFEAGRIRLLDFTYSRMVFVYDWLLSMAVFSGSRLVVRIVQILVRSNESNLISTIVVGSGEMAQVCIAEISEKPRLGYKLIGTVTTHDGEDTSSVRKYGARVLGQFDDLPELIRKFNIEEVLITDTGINSGKMFEVLMECGRDHQIKYRVVPDLFDCLPGKTEIDTIGSLPMIKLYEEPLRGWMRAVKRSIDVAAAGALLIVTIPVWAVFAFLIRRESKGPVFLKQERVGMDGKVFLMIKFRSMRTGGDDQAHRELMARMISGEDANQGTSDEPIYGKVKDDPRLTRLGSWMRRYSIDELPQILNVLKGDMSMVGPRPPLPYEVKHYKDWHRSRFHVRPGLTGLWQVSGRNRLHFEEMVRLDIFYIENWSPWLDLKIMLKTLPVMLKGDNTY
jgi:exopolysaccharide biosynthesis polyprenyl glycosylphosphotransferase